MKQLVLIFCILVSSQLSAQNHYTSPKLQLSFDTSETLEEYETESESVIGFDNDDFAVDIEIIAADQQSDNFLNDLRYVAHAIARDFGLVDIQDGGKLPKIENAYYVKAYDFDDGLKYPCYIIAISDPKLKNTFEISIDCYNGNANAADEIVKSIRLNP
ncbi:hypothetical protein [Robertkochia solimangrovi]|uniref:hypothetical protein n=1 Tax=Robertkochia solimangrovi TaxID=2213046 RepID=UPI0011805225|nr:hypothetical protein [Robertkochia solimangrovi]TRZ44348.1 hypothetical protein DMZ48_07510 [Robertkochia solimangrovi]